MSLLLGGVLAVKFIVAMLRSRETGLFARLTWVAGEAAFSLPAAVSGSSVGVTLYLDFRSYTAAMRQKPPALCFSLLDREDANIS